MEKLKIIIAELGELVEQKDKLENKKNISTQEIRRLNQINRRIWVRIRFLKSFEAKL